MCEISRDRRQTPVRHDDRTETSQLRHLQDALVGRPSSGRRCRGARTTPVDRYRHRQLADVRLASLRPHSSVFAGNISEPSSKEEFNDMGFAEDRLVAEQALAIYDLGSPREPIFPPVAARILRAREALGLTQDDVAARWGEQPSMYWDLELYDDEAFTVISVKQLQRLAAALGTSVSALLFSEEPPPGFPGATYAEVVARLRKKIAEDAVSSEDLSDRIGWELRPLLADPDTLGDLPIDGLRSVCRAAGVDWVAALRTAPDNGPQAGR